MMMSPNTTTTGDNNNDNDNVDDNSGLFVLNINPKDKLLLTNIDPIDPTINDLVTMNNILHNVYQVDEKQQYGSDYFDHYDYSYDDFDFDFVSCNDMELLRKNLIVLRS